MNIKNNKGVTLVVLTITIIVLMIITSVVIYNAKAQLAIKYLNNLYSDINSLETKIATYYLEFGTLPVYENREFVATKNDLKSVFQSHGGNENTPLNVNDSGKYYVIDLTKLDNLTLNYGKGYNAWGSGLSTNSNNNVDVYIINEVTHQIYYPNGISLEGIRYFSKDIDEKQISAIQFDEKTESWEIIVNNLSKSTTNDNKVLLNAKVELNLHYNLNTEGIQYLWSEETDVTKIDKSAFTDCKLNNNNEMTLTSKPVNYNTQKYNLWIKVKDINGYEHIQKKELYISLEYEPKVGAGMIPVKFNTEQEKWEICSIFDEDWYNYLEDSKRWANIMLEDGKYTTATATEGTIVDEKDLGSMFVWIPRFAYKIPEGYHGSNGTNGKMDVVWLRKVEGNMYDYVNDKGVLIREGTSRSAKNGNTGATAADYYIAHPCFTNGTSYGYKNGEWDEEITGIWVSKFQAGIKTTDNDLNYKVNLVQNKVGKTNTARNLYYPIFKGRKFAYNFVTVSQCYDLAEAISREGNPYGVNENSQSHLMKNSEWGAASYLSISRYGYSDGVAGTTTEKYKNDLSISSYVVASTVQHPNNSSNYITAVTGYSATGTKYEQNIMTYENPNSFTDSIVGTSGTENTSYAWNVVDSGKTYGNGTKSSTTGNIYGIYDMGGCLSNYTSSYVNATGSSNLVTYGASFATGTSTKYATAYPYQTDTSVTYITNNNDFSSAYPGFKNIFGDAIYETSSNIGGNFGWFSQGLEDDAGLNESFFPRGGSWFATGGIGVCGISDNSGASSNAYGFHSVLIVK
ncbi:MAG: hypothetical protein IKF38_06205 [Clostridia bacterium]|nr:hypothetical protein [Clostridia bacterium]